MSVGLCHSFERSGEGRNTRGRMTVVAVDESSEPNRRRRMTRGGKGGNGRCASCFLVSGFPLDSDRLVVRYDGGGGGDEKLSLLLAGVWSSSIILEDGVEYPSLRQSVVVPISTPSSIIYERGGRTWSRRGNRKCPRDSRFDTTTSDSS